MPGRRYRRSGSFDEGGMEMGICARIGAVAAGLLLAMSGTALAAAPGSWSATTDVIPGGDAPLYLLRTAARPSDGLVATVTTSGGLTHAALYDPGAGGFTEIAPPLASSNRQNWPIAWGPDGRLYLAQRLTSACCTEHHLWAYTAATDTWAQVADMPAFPDALLSGPSKLLLLNHLQTFTFDLGTKTWTARAHMPHPAVSFASARSTGAYYVLGGRAPGSTEPTNTVQVYHTASNTWTAAPAMPRRRAGAVAATAADGRIFVLGGTDWVGRAVPWVDVFNPATN